MTNIKQIQKEDNIFATIASKGKTIKSIVGKNFNNINEVIKLLTSSCYDFRGLVQLTIRNQSQGWNINMLLRINNTFACAKEQPHDGLQYRFTF